MTTFVALLRGVNVGKAKRVPMSELRRLLEAIGCTSVVTLLNSGNAVFRSPKAPSAKVAAEIAAAIAAQLNVTVPVVVKSSSVYDAVVNDNPFAIQAKDHSRLLVAFTQDSRALSTLASIAALAEPPDEFCLGKHAAYLHCATGILESRIGTAILGKPGSAATTRNWATCLKLLELLRRCQAGPT